MSTGLGVGSARAAHSSRFDLVSRRHSSLIGITAGTLSEITFVSGSKATGSLGTVIATGTVTGTVVVVALVLVFAVTSLTVTFSTAEDEEEEEELSGTGTFSAIVSETWISTATSPTVLLSESLGVSLL